MLMTIENVTIVVAISCVILLVLGLGRWLDKIKGYPRPPLWVEGTDPIPRNCCPGCLECQATRILLGIGERDSPASAIERLLVENDDLRNQLRKPC